MVGIITISCACGAIYIAVGIVSASSGRDFGQKMSDRISSTLPDWLGGSATSDQRKAWASRVPGTIKELQLWSSNPVLGRGFAIEDAIASQVTEAESTGFRHNSWVSTLLDTGIFGFAGMVTLVVAMFAIGKRMVVEQCDRETVLMGALAVICAVFSALVGYATMSFGQVRWGLPTTITFGVLMRVRARQLALRDQWAGYLDTSSHHAVESNAEAFGAFGAPADFAEAGI
jgi:hypothetical protein